MTEEEYAAIYYETERIYAASHKGSRGINAMAWNRIYDDLVAAHRNAERRRKEVSR